MDCVLLEYFTCTLPVCYLYFTCGLPVCYLYISAHTGEVELCKICMDRLVDCVLLECGHMLTCTQCGRQLAECPICRQYVVRVVHVFKS